MKSFWLLLALSFFAIPLNYLNLLPKRVWKMGRTILACFWFTRRNSFNTKTKPLPIWARPLYYSGILLFKIVDLTGLCELMDFLMLIFKPNSRSMTKIEIDEAAKVFGPDFPFWQVRIDEKSKIAQMGANFIKKPKLGMGLVLFRSINFNRKIDCLPNNGDMAWLVHELTHVKQMQSIGSSYILESWLAQNYWGYDYGGVKEIEEIPLEQFNVEQQAQIMRSFYEDVVYGNTDENLYQDAIQEMNLGLF